MAQIRNPEIDEDQINNAPALKSNQEQSQQENIMKKSSTKNVCEI